MFEITFQEMKLEGGWLMIRPEKQDLGAVMALIRKTGKGKLLNLIIKPFRKKRSQDANSYAWVLIHKLAKAMRLKPEEVYREAVRNIGDNFTPICIREKDVERFRKSWEGQGLGWPVEDLGPSQVPGCRNLMAYHGSSTFDTVQMGQLIDGLIQDCKALDIETLPPEKLALLVGEWK